MRLTRRCIFCLRHACAGTVAAYLALVRRSGGTPVFADSDEHLRFVGVPNDWTRGATPAGAPPVEPVEPTLRRAIA